MEQKHSECEVSCKRDHKESKEQHWYIFHETLLKLWIQYYVEFDLDKANQDLKKKYYQYKNILISCLIGGDMKN